MRTTAPAKFGAGNQLLLDAGPSPVARIRSLSASDRNQLSGNARAPRAACLPPDALPSQPEEVLTRIQISIRRIPSSRLPYLKGCRSAECRRKVRRCDF